MIDQCSKKEVSELRECMVRDVMRLMGLGKLLIAINFNRFAECECEEMTLVFNNFLLTDVAKIAFEVTKVIELLIKITEDAFEGFCTAKLVEH